MGKIGTLKLSWSLDRPGISREPGMRRKRKKVQESNFDKDLG